MSAIVSRVLATFGKEDKAQREVILHCQAEGIPVFHVPNNTYTTSIMQKVRNTLLGVVEGVPDLFLIVRGRLIAIEMKSHTGVASKAQKEWVARLNKAGVPAKVCKGAKQAFEFMDSIEPLPEGVVPPAIVELPDVPVIPPTKPFDDGLPF